YVQMRMSACTAYMAGYDLKSDQVQTLVYACLAGVSVNEVIKKASVKFGEKFANSLIEKIPGKVLVKINQKLGFRFITKFGEKGLVNLGKMIPGIGAVINGGLDLVETKAIGSRAYKFFIEMDPTMGIKKKDNDADSVEVEIEDSDFA
ncbi:MAG: EcsC family protein, partial [Clostridia bacterium]|nr:EcsC family protein [Clostridia bacterium]